jgi:NAD(P)-dependent dehydrogenase (short-subunit alcohol dehydrogenase family)
VTGASWSSAGTVERENGRTVIAARRELHAADGIARTSARAHRHRHRRGRGIGREHALAFAREGARVVVNDLGVARDGTGADRPGPAQVVDEIIAAGGEARRQHRRHRRLGRRAPARAHRDRHLRRLDVLVNNAGFLRDRMVFTTGEDEWDAVIRVHLKGHFATDAPRDRVVARRRPRPASRSTAGSSTRRRAPA